MRTLFLTPVSVTCPPSTRTSSRSLAVYSNVVALAVLLIGPVADDLVESGVHGRDEIGMGHPTSIVSGGGFTCLVIADPLQALSH